jgi:lipopolysaccharide transport system permease protein
MYASPVVYPTSLIPAHLRWAHALNPMVGVIDGLRFALFASGTPPGAPFFVSLTASVALAAIGIACFARMERSFSDVV